MDVIEYYRQQHQWRHWPDVYEAVPPIRDSVVLDLGCGVGDQAADLATLGARVIGIDANEGVVAAAKARNTPSCLFIQADLRALPLSGQVADAIWSSFAAAYFPGLTPVLRRWRDHLHRGGWMALTEIEDLFGHSPLSDVTRSYLDGYCAAALEANRYDFHMGRKLADFLMEAGLHILSAFDVPDDEFCLDGPVGPGIAAAWRRRLEGMSLLREHCGTAFSTVRDDFLHCITSREHRADSRVCCVVADWQGGA
jgi:SAM-dependent methyltransferase